MLDSKIYHPVIYMAFNRSSTLTNYTIRMLLNIIIIILHEKILTVQSVLLPLILHDTYILVL